MKLQKIHLACLPGLVVLGVALVISVSWRFISGDRPSISGTLRVPGLEKEVKIVRDNLGVPHIFAETEHDLFFAAGFVQAQDRWFQMDLMRLMVQGRTSEIAGKEGLDGDFRNRVIGFHRMSEHAMKILSPHSMAVLQAYSDGVNACLKAFPDRIPLEHKALGLATGYQPSPWEPQDSIAVAIYVDWELAGNWDNELQRWQVSRKFGETVAQELLPYQHSPCPVIVPEAKDLPFVQEATPEASLLPMAEKVYPYEELKDTVSLNELKAFLGKGHSASALREPAGAPRLASNSWVVSAARSKQKVPILCNDPHLEYVLPSVWVEMHLKGAGYDSIGVAFPGTPIMAIGHNQHIAWGATTTCADYQDLFQEKVDESAPMASYIYGDSSEPFKVMEEVFKVREGRILREERRKVLFSRHGPIINPLVDWLDPDDPPLALRWSAYDLKDMLDGLTDVNRASSWDEFLAGMTKVGGPVQNWIYASKNGDIGYIANGLIPARSQGDGMTPLDGSSPACEWRGGIPQRLLPQILNPAKGYIATANNRVVEEGLGFPVAHHFATGYRAERIVELIEKTPLLDVSDMETIQGDVLIARGRRIAPHLVRAYEAYPVQDPPSLARAASLLKEWDYIGDEDSAAASIFEVTMLKISDPIFADNFPDGFHRRINWFLRLQLDNLIAENEYEHWFDDVNTPEVEGRDEILVKALQEACRFLEEEAGPDPDQWQWGKLHQMRWEHILVSEAGLPEVLARFFRFGPFPIGGEDETINCQDFNSGSVPFQVDAGPSMRMIVAMTDPPTGYITNTTGQSGQRTSRHFVDQIDDWLHVRYHRMLTDPKEIEKVAEGQLLLTP